MKASDWKHNILEALEALANLDKQGACWLGGMEFYPNPAELICQLGDDTA